MAIFMSNNYKVINNDKPLDGRLVMTQTEIDAIDNEELGTYIGQIIYNSTTGWYHSCANGVANQGIIKLEAGDTIRFFSDDDISFGMNGGTKTSLSIHNAIDICADFSNNSSNSYISVSSIDDQGLDIYPHTSMNTNSFSVYGVDHGAVLGVNFVSDVQSNGYLRISDIIDNMNTPQDYLYLNIGDVKHNQSFTGNTRGVSMIGTGLKVSASNNYADNALIVGRYNDPVCNGDVDVYFAVGHGNNGDNRKNIFAVTGDGLTIADELIVNYLTVDNANIPSDIQTYSNLAETVDDIRQSYNTSKNQLPLISTYTITGSNITTNNDECHNINGFVRDVSIRISEAFNSGATLTISLIGNSTEYLLQNYDLSQIPEGSVSVEPIYDFCTGNINVSVNGATEGLASIFIEAQSIGH